MTPLRELRYDSVTLFPRARSFPRHPGTRRRDTFHPHEIFPPIRVADFLPRKKRIIAGRDTGGDAPAAGAERPRNRKPRLSTPEPGGPTLKCWISGSSEEEEEEEEEEDEEEEEEEDEEEEEEEDEDEFEATARYVVGPDSIRFLPPVDRGSLVVFDRWREVHVPSPWPWGQSYWSKKQEPWQSFYLDRGAGWRAKTEKEMNQELWIAFLLDRGAGRQSRWWMEVELAFASARAIIDAPPCPAKRRYLGPADDSAAAAPDVQPLGQDTESGATQEDRRRDGETDQKPKTTKS
jgi:hypothetical protein